MLRGDAAVVRSLHLGRIVGNRSPSLLARQCDALLDGIDVVLLRLLFSELSSRAECADARLVVLHLIARRCRRAPALLSQVGRCFFDRSS